MLDIRGLVFEFIWITSNQAYLFNDILQIPIKDINYVRSAFKNYRNKFLNLVKNSPNAPYDGYLEKDFLAEIEANGENLNNINFWLLAIKDHNIKKDGVETGIYAVSYWNDYLNAICEHAYEFPKTENIENFIDQYKDNVFLNNEDFYKRSQIAEVDWMNNKDKMPYEKFLWDTYYKQFDMSPLSMFSNYPENLFFRNNWRKQSHLLTGNDKELLYFGLLNFLQDSTFSDVEIVKWEYVWPLDEAIDIENIPDFNMVKNRN